MLLLILNMRHSTSCFCFYTRKYFKALIHNSNPAKQINPIIYIMLNRMYFEIFPLNENSSEN